MKKAFCLFCILLLLGTAAQADVVEDTWVCLKCGMESSGNACVTCNEPRGVWACVDCGTRNLSDTCSNCGKEVDPGYAFCPACGQKVEAAEPAKEDAPEAQPEEPVAPASEETAETADSDETAE